MNLVALSIPILEREDRAEVRAEAARKVRRALERINRLISDLLDVTRIEANALSVTRQNIDIGSLLSEAQEAFRPLADERQIRLHREPVREGMPVLSADRERLLQVLGNLVGNALKFTAPAGTVSLEAASDGREVRFVVRDTGTGIRPEELPHLFDRFFQGTRQARTGAGLGLAIARGIVSAHGGKIGVESRLGEGSAFWFTIPTSNVADARPTADHRRIAARDAN